MKRFSLKIKLTLLYTFFMILVAGAAIAVLFSLSSNEILASVQNQLKNQVQESIDDIEEDDGGLDIDSDFFLLENNIYLSVYSTDGVFLYGKNPHGFEVQPELSDGELQTRKEGGRTWYVYDLLYKIEDYGRVYIRGITSATQAENEFRVTMRFLMILMPFLILVTAIVGYRIVSRALRPVRKLTETVEEIQKGEDLSRRIEAAEYDTSGQDEINRLAVTFDRMLEKLEEAFRREKQFTSDVAHELRTPISVMLAQCSTCLKDGNFSESQKEQIRVIERKARQMAGMVSQLLLLSRADQGRQQLAKEYLNLSELTEMTAEEQQMLADKKRIKIWPEIETDIYGRVDETFYIRMLINLISNAIYYGNDGGNIWVTLKKGPDEVTGKDMIIGSVRDDGIGIGAEELHHIWERFYRADKSRADGGHSGLGLSMVKWIAEAHGGRIQAESTPGSGSTFTFMFPGE